MDDFFFDDGPSEAGEGEEELPAEEREANDRNDEVDVLDEAIEEVSTRRGWPQMRQMRG